MAEIPYSNGVQNGTIQTFFEGSGSLNEKIERRNDQRNGQYQEYDKNGQLLVNATYKDNMLNGAKTYFYANGKPMLNLTYYKGVLNGEATSFDEQGNKLISMKFANNLPDGAQTAYYPNGKVKFSKNYKNGVWNGKTYKEYDEKGLLEYEVKDSGYEISYLKNNGSGNMIKMSDKEKTELLKRIDNRETEKEIVTQFLANQAAKK